MFQQDTWKAFFSFMWYQARNFQNVAFLET